MQELKNTSIHHTALKLTSDIQAMKIYASLYKTVQVCFISFRKKKIFYIINKKKCL